MNASTINYEQKTDEVRSHHLWKIVFLTFKHLIEIERLKTSIQRQKWNLQTLYWSFPSIGSMK